MRSPSCISPKAFYQVNPTQTEKLYRLAALLHTHKKLVIAGGAKGPVWRQMMADIFNARIKAPAMLEEANSMGAAVTGGVGVGLFKDFDAIDRFMEITAVHEPNPEAVKAYAPVKEMFEACYQAMLPIYEKMAMK